MTSWSGFRSWFTATLQRSRMESEMDAELRFHIEAFAEDLMRGGMSRPEALRRAWIEFGGIEQAKEGCREARGAKIIETLVQDLRYGARMLRKNPGFTAVAVLTLALGIGANTAIFSLVNGILLRPLPFAMPQNLVSITGTYPKGAFVVMREEMQSLDSAAYFEGHEFNLTNRGEPLRLSGVLVSAEFFNVLGARPELGRPFYPGEDLAGQDSYVILSHSLWEQHFNSDPSVIGHSIELEGVSRQVVGVMPADFNFPSSKTQVWIPLHNDPRDTIAYWAGDFMPIIGRLRPGSTIAQARAEIHMFQSRVSKLFPWPMPADWNAGISVVSLRNGMVADLRGRLFLLLGAVSLILLIACVNVANLTLSRAATREKEIALRTAMGAERGRVIRQLLTESVLLAFLGGSLGTLLAIEGLRSLKAVLPADTPRLADTHIDWRVLAFTAGLTILTGLLFGLAPALHSSRAALVESLKSASRAASTSVSQNLRSGLAIAEVAFAVLLVIAAGLLIRSFVALSRVDPGFRAERILTARITPNQEFCYDPARCISFYRELLARLQAVPGVISVAVVNTLPLDGRVAKRALEIENEPVSPGEASPLFWMDVVTPDYFRLMGIPVAVGRAFTSADDSGNPPVALVTASTARRFWPGGSPVGSHVRLSGDKDWRTIVGVVSDVRAYDMQKNVPDWINGTIYFPYTPNATLEGGRVPSDMTVVVQSSLDVLQVQNALRSDIAGLIPEVPASEVKPMRAVISESVSTPASTTELFVAFAGLALVLGLIGIYGVLSFLVSRRTREIGIRLALGAQRRDVLWLIMKEGAKFSLVGISLGLVAALAITRLLAGELYGVSPADPATFFGAAGLMTAVTLLACYIPTRRAMLVDPLIALRQD
ncbi:MAG: ADOP family duplicated permease [Candidatus Acidiferrales bacterium]